MSCVGRYLQYPHSILLSIESIPSILPPFLTIIPSKPHRPPNTSPLLMLRIAPLLLQDPLMFLHSPVHPPPPITTCLSNQYMPLTNIASQRPLSKYSKYCLSPSSFQIFQIFIPNIPNIASHRPLSQYSKYCLSPSSLQALQCLSLLLESLADNEHRVIVTKPSHILISR